MMKGPAHYSPRTEVMPTHAKRCRYCRKRFVRGKNEAIQRYADRKFCSTECSNADKRSECKQTGDEPWLEEIAAVEEPKQNVWGRPLKRTNAARMYAAAVAMSHGHGGGNW